MSWRILLEDRIKRCKNTKRLNELLALDEDQLLVDAANIEQQADRIENALLLGDRFSADLWRWLDGLVDEAINDKVRVKTRQHIKDVVIATVYNYRVPGVWPWAEAASVKAGYV